MFPPSIGIDVRLGLLFLSMLYVGEGAGGANLVCIGRCSLLDSAVDVVWLSLSMYGTLPNSLFYAAAVYACLRGLSCSFSYYDLGWRCSMGKRRVLCLFCFFSHPFNCCHSTYNYFPFAPLFLLIDLCP